MTCKNKPTINDKKSQQAKKQLENNVCITYDK